MNIDEVHGARDQSLIDALHHRTLRIRTSTDILVFIFLAGEYYAPRRFSKYGKLPEDKKFLLREMISILTTKLSA